MMMIGTGLGLERARIRSPFHSRLFTMTTVEQREGTSANCVAQNECITHFTSDDIFSDAGERKERGPT
jgi:hypothetical protein